MQPLPSDAFMNWIFIITFLIWLELQIDSIVSIALDRNGGQEKGSIKAMRNKKITMKMRKHMYSYMNVVLPTT